MARKSINHYLGSLTDAERLWLWRQRSKLTQTQAAKQLGRALRTYQSQERGYAALWGGEPLIRHSITDAEMCLLARRRMSWGLRATAKRAKTSHVTLLRDEGTGAPALIDFWKRQGFKFAVAA